ncbi:pantoate-beta-alanine ligase protein [Rutstroemia sp. NJR-2017a BBW]|nr:pantoate-beta-alanine ligase protein [Rutstroemia sp. NJR-2017a BBW]
MLTTISKPRLPLLCSAPKICYISRGFTASATLLRRSAEPTIPNTPIKIFRDVPALRLWRRKQLVDYRTVGLVPTMGALHTGHLSLIRLAAAENSNVVVSIYVNPTQFGLHEDLDSYPKTWDADCKMLRDLDRELAENGNMGKIAAVFAPTTETMYPSGRPSQEVNAKGSFVTITPVGELLEGSSRPTFFRGVATVCMKLFNIVLPEKQQLEPEERVKFEVDYISLADPETMEEIKEIDETKGAILSGAIKMLPVESPQEGEDLGAAGGPPVRLIDNIILKPIES